MGYEDLTSFSWISSKGASEYYNEPSLQDNIILFLKLF